MKKLWLIFIAIFVFSFAILGWVGTEIFRQAPPIPREVVKTGSSPIVVYLRANLPIIDRLDG
jgi:nitric oxide reductase subunit B